MLAVQRHDDVVHVRLDRPEVRNAFAPPLIAALTDWARESHGSAGVRAAVLSGAGKAFCAGADLTWMRESRAYGEADNLADAERLADLFEALARVPFPLVGRVHGAALGGGAGLLAVCDHVVVTADATIGFSEVRLGLIPAVIAPFVARRIGWSAARSLFLTGRRFDGTEAVRLGLAHEVVDAAALDAAVAAVLDDLHKGAASAHAAIKVLLGALEGEPHDVRLLTTAAIARQRVSADGQEGLTAFLEKRPPSWADDDA